MGQNVKKGVTFQTVAVIGVVIIILLIIAVLWLLNRSASPTYPPTQGIIRTVGPKLSPPTTPVETGSKDQDNFATTYKAIMKYNADTKTFPGSLQDMVPKYLSQDLANNKKVSYSRSGSDFSFCTAFVKGSTFCLHAADYHQPK